ncbi:MAG TPA: hypothetical protein PK999_19135 [Nitrospira sp.]|nr:hypothetical protein [Nitrospira sp.]
MLRSLSALFFWFLRAWPVLSLVPIALAHASAHRFFLADAVLVNKITGTVLQVVGGLIVLYSVNSNLGLFRDQHFGKIILGWFRSFPLFRRSVTLSASGIASATAFGNARVSVRRATSTIEEKVAELERQIEEFRQHVSEDFRAANERIAQVHSELSTAVATNTATLNHLSSKLELVTVGGFKQQAFGVLLAVYGAVTSVFA